MFKLNYLEITNFKSYKDTYKIPFTNHFTCIIGPNGSGKSNILDAIVFCTTNKPYNVRNSTVKLVLSDGRKEMTFTRYINTSGKSSYFVNTKKVMYKEYINNFIIYQAHTQLNVTDIIDKVSGSYKYKDEYDKLNKEYTDLLTKLKIESEARKQYLSILKENKKYEEEVNRNLELVSKKKEMENKLFEATINNLFVKYNKLNNIDYKKILENREIKKENDLIISKKNILNNHKEDLQDNLEQKINFLDKLNQDIKNLDLIKPLIDGFEELEKEYYKMLNDTTSIKLESIDIYNDVVLKNLIKSKEELEFRNVLKINDYSKLISDETYYTKVLNEVNNEIIQNKNIKMKSVKMYNLKSKINKIHGVIGFIPDLIKCTNEKYKIAINSLINKYENTVIVKDEDCAINCIQFCKTNRLGRITCIISKNYSSTIQKKNNNMIDPILVTEYFPDIKNVVEFIFSKVLITDTLFHELNYQDIDLNYDICTIDGILIKNKGRLIKYSSNVLEQVDELVIKRMNLIDKLNLIKKQKAQYSNIEIIQERIKKLEGDIENRKMVLNKKINKKEISPNIVESKVFGDIFIKNGYKNYNDYITRNSKYYKDEKKIRKDFLFNKKQKLENEINKIKIEINKIQQEDSNLILNNIDDFEEYPIIDIEGEKDKILEEIRDLYFIEKNEIYNEKIDNTYITSINLDDLKSELHKINNLLNSSSHVIKNTLKTDFNSENYDTLKNKTFEIKGLLNTVKNQRINLVMECIKIINENINSLYSKLFEGSCNLVVENPEDPFSGNIKYYVMVPNKKYKEYSHLSGGEQMISRIIFMYGIYYFKRIKKEEEIIPSFILLDEVDSNLDNYNVNKLVQFIKNEDIQVVMVSLKIGVYKECDTMIGVYKREGKSNILFYSF